MAEEGQFRKMVSWIEGLDRTVTFLMAIPVFGGIIKKMFETTAKKAESGFGSWLGTEPDASGEGQTDNQIVDIVASRLQPIPRRAFREFCLDLYRKDPVKYKLFTGRIASLAELDAKKRTTKKNPAKGSNDPIEITEAKERDYEAARVWLEAELLTYITYNDKMSFLEGAGVFEKDKAKKEAPGVTFIKKTAVKGKDLLKITVEKGFDTATERATKARLATAENLTDLEKTTINWKEQSRIWYEERKALGNARKAKKS